MSALFLTDSPGAVAAETLATQAASGLFLSAAGSPHEQDLPVGWTRCDSEALLDFDELRRSYLEFLEAWPHKASPSPRSFDDLFKVDARHSIWWTSVGVDRQVNHGVFKLFRWMALVDRALERYAPPRVLLFTTHPVVATLIESRAREEGIPVERLPGCAAPANRNVGVSVSWALRATGRALLHWVRSVPAAIRCRRALRGAQLWKRSARPVAVFTSRFERYMSLDGGVLAPVYWREISDALTTAAPAIEQAYLPRRLDQIADAEGRLGIDAVRDIRAPLIVRESVVPVRGQVGAVLRQISACWRFYRVARTRAFRESFRFANADMAPAAIPNLRDSLAAIVEWSFRVGQFRGALRAAGNVRVVIVSEEMYRPAMPVMAAAAELGIPTVGVQHGTIMPAHITYTPPRGHIQHAPVPDAFAAYGSYAKQIISGLGAYPADAVWITGPARLDSLVTRRMAKEEARARLKIPAGKRVVVLATQTYAWFPAVIRGVLECVREYPDVVLCVKKHPSVRAMSLDEIAALARTVGAADVRGFESDLELLLFASDLWISATSTTILESALVGTPSICVNFSGEPDWYPYVEEGGSLPARSVEELMRSMARALEAGSDGDSGRDRLTFLTRHAGPAKDGRAAITLAERIAELCQRPGRARLPLAAA
jgi:hypothetical protein